MKITLKTASRFIIICLVATGLNLFGLIFLEWGMLATFIASGLFVFLAWERSRSWELKFSTATVVFFLSLALFYLVLPFKDGNWIRNDLLVILVVLFLVVYWLGCYLGSIITRQPINNINPSSQ